MSKKGKRFVIVAALLLSALTFVAVKDRIAALKFIWSLDYPFNLINSITASLKTEGRELWSVYYENKRLKKELSEALLDRQRFEETVHENKRLKEILSLKAQLPNYVASAKVISRGYDRLLNTMIIDKGSRHGIRKDMAVITTRGLVGKVYSVKEDFSEILHLKDPNFSAAVRLQKSRAEGVLSGTGYDYVILKYIQPQENVEQDEAVVTSGLDGLFPTGLQAGRVSFIKREGVEFYQQIRVQPLQPIEKIEEVLVVR
ncbi:MAG: rod shape-determining protein MreC [Nitrospirae bacterium]|nr:rod shape-determining protein MreC [Nitrospirota bacterium]